MTNAAAGVHRRARERGGVAGGDKGTAGDDAGGWACLARYGPRKGATALFSKAEAGAAESVLNSQHRDRKCERQVFVSRNAAHINVR